MIGICAIVFFSMAFFIYYQNLSFQQELNLNKEKLMHLNSTLNNYVDLFGMLPDNYTSIPFLLHLKVYVADPLNTTPVDIVKVNQPYQVIAQVVRQENQPIRNYYCIIQVQDEKGFDIADGWSQQTMIPKQPSSQCAIRWIPNSIGNYTISAFAWQDMFGNARAEPAIKNVQVVSFLDNERISVMRTDGTYTGFSVNYTITGNNQIIKANSDVNTKSLVLSLETIINGTLVIDLPRGLIDPKTNGQDSQFIIIEDGKEDRYTQIKTTDTDRILSIPFQYGVSKLEIISPEPIP